ncbi:unnamed protein product, partial [Urochloa humidicola]
RPGEAAAPRVEGRAGEAAAATLDGRRRHPRRPSSVSVLRPFRPSAEPTALPRAPLRPFGPSAEPAAVDDADRAPGRRHSGASAPRSGPPRNDRGRRLRRPISYLGAAPLQLPPPPAVQDPRWRLLASKISTGYRLAFDCGH